MTKWATWCAMPWLVVLSLCASARAGERELRVMSYNIHGMILVKNDHSRYAKIGRLLKERRAAGTAPEIVALQEAFHSRTKDLWAEAGYPYVQRGRKGMGFRISSGLVVLSEYPIEGYEQMVYDDCMSVDCFARKGAMRVLVRVPGMPFPVEIANTHLQATYDGAKFPPARLTEKARFAQVGDLVRFLSPGSLPAFFAGDFNMVPEEPEYARFVDDSGAENGARLCIEDSSGCDGAFETAHGFSSYIDHVFVRSAGHGQAWDARPVRYRRSFREVVDGDYLSDHFAVESTWLIRW